MPIKWSNYSIVTTALGNQVVIAKFGKDPYIIADKSDDLTNQAVNAVYQHMKTEYERKKREDSKVLNLMFTFTDGSILTYTPPESGERVSEASDDLREV